MLRKLSERLEGLRDNLKTIIIYYYPDDNAHIAARSFEIRISTRKTCAELLEILVSTDTPFLHHQIDSLTILLTPQFDDSSSTAKVFPPSDSILRNVPEADSQTSNFTLRIHYFSNAALIESYEVELSAGYSSNDDLYSGLIRSAKENAPSKFTATETQYPVSLTMTYPNSESPGCNKFTKGDLPLLISGSIKLWIEKQIPFNVRITDQDVVQLKFYPEEEFGFIKWTVSTKIKKEFDSFYIIARHNDEGSTTMMEMDCKLHQFPNHSFEIMLKNQNSIAKETWNCAHNLDQFDFFFSHRKHADKDVVQLLHEQLNGLQWDHDHAIHAFWDDQCLSASENWEIGFTSALEHSKIVILIISIECVRKIKAADVEEDNVLLEWELALLRKAFNEFDYTDFPEAKHCHTRSPRIFTVRKVMQQIFQIQGEFFVGKNDVDRIITKLQNTLSKLEKSNSSKVIAPVSDRSLTAIQEERLQKLLNPLDMRKERSRLLESHVKNTRKWLLKSLMEFLNPKNSDEEQEQILWIQGNAGVGKSVMAAYLANELEKRDLLGGTFFAKYDDDGRNNARNLIRTVCYQMCEWNADFRKLIFDKLSDEQVVSEAFRARADVEKLFHHLILSPLREIAKSHPKPIVLVVDALDEAGFMGYRSEILSVFSVHCKKLPTFVKIVVTSRPDADIMREFKSLKKKILSPSNEENQTDVLLCSERFFREKGFESNELYLLSGLLAKKSEGLFVWLAMACRILGSVDNISVADIEALGAGKSDKLIDDVYFSTFDRIFGELPNERMSEVLCLAVLAFEPLTAENFSIFLDIPPDEIDEILNKLKPILNLNEDDDSIHIFHKSVVDYLTDPKRCFDSRFSVDSQRFHARLTEKCLAILKESLIYNIANLPSHTLHVDILNFDERVSFYVPAYLKYAVLYFWKHHVKSQDAISHAKGIREFAKSMLLNWIEVLSLLRSTNIIPSAIRALTDDYVSASESHLPDYTLELLFDTTRLYQKFKTPISASALQTYVTAIPFSPTESRIYKQYYDKLPTCEIPKVRAGLGTKWPACLMVLEGHASNVKAAAISVDGNLIVSGSSDKTIKIWSMESGEELKTLKGHNGAVTSVAISDDGGFIVSGSDDKLIKIWSVHSGQEIRECVGHTLSVNSVAVSRDGNYIVSGSNDRKLKIWSVESGKEIRSLAGHSNWVRSVRISADGTIIVSGSDDKTVKVWNFQTGNELYSFTGHTSAVHSVAISKREGQWVVSGSSDKSIKVWSVESGEQMTLTGHLNAVCSIETSDDSEVICSGSEDKTLKIWSIKTGEEIQTLRGHSDFVNSVEISNDGHFAVSASRDKTVMVWSLSLECGDDYRHPNGHVDEVNGIAISRDGCMMVSCSRDKTLRLWTFEDGDLIRILHGHSNWVNNVAISTDIKYISSEDINGNIIYHDVGTGEVLELSDVAGCEFGRCEQNEVNLFEFRKGVQWSIIDGFEF
ncbi:hypothetical protein HK098_001268 [Nowakowskiella sp. JEL0407]|nr:hypothetical protein HK098_001268 [Nowakowskiella sp. JEL0407]